MNDRTGQFDVVVIGGGHAGAEAAWAAANTGASVALLTLDPSKIGVMSCNPAIGGLAKGQIVREIDALGGLMGVVADATGIMFKVLNQSRGPAVRGPRAQCDRHAYARCVQRMLSERPNITIIEGAASSFVTEPGGSGRRRVTGVVVRSKEADGDASFVLHAPAVVLTTGTFMRGLMHRGEQKSHGGREGEAPSVGMSGALREMGFELGRLKTGTPPRLRRSTIDWDALEDQWGDEPPVPFSDLTDVSAFPSMPQISCKVTATTPAVHDVIRANLHRAPMYSGQIESVGPRYCPSIEDKVVRFADRGSHHVFLEPESHESDWVYCNGIPTSLPGDVQDAIVAGLPGCARAQIVQHGYAVEYDMVLPSQIDSTCMTKLVDGLFLAGQINGTSGYEEAAGQGLVAGLNASRVAAGLEPVRLGREQAYIGVMLDDLVVKVPTEPYRMFSSRAEHRLLLRADNASDRLTPLGREWGLVDDARWAVHSVRRNELQMLQDRVRATRVAGRELAAVARTPRFGMEEFIDALGPEDAWLPKRSVLQTCLADLQYAGYLARHRNEAERQSQAALRPIPREIDYRSIAGLRAETVQVLNKFRPATVGQAARLAGVNPPDITLLMVAMRRGASAGPPP